MTDPTQQTPTGSTLPNGGEEANAERGMRNAEREELVRDRWKEPPRQVVMETEEDRCRVEFATVKRLLKEYDLSPRAGAVGLLIAEESLGEGRAFLIGTQKHLALALDYDKGTISKAVAELEEAGLLMTRDGARYRGAPGLTEFRLLPMGRLAPPPRRDEARPMTAEQLKVRRAALYAMRELSERAASAAAAARPELEDVAGQGVLLQTVEERLELEQVAASQASVPLPPKRAVDLEKLEPAERVRELKALAEIGVELTPAEWSEIVGAELSGSDGKDGRNGPVAASATGAVDASATGGVAAGATGLPISSRGGGRSEFTNSKDENTSGIRNSQGGAAGIGSAPPAPGVSGASRLGSNCAEGGAATTGHVRKANDPEVLFALQKLQKVGGKELNELLLDKNDGEMKPIRLFKWRTRCRQETHAVIRAADMTAEDLAHGEKLDEPLGRVFKYADKIVKALGRKLHVL